MNWDCIIDRKIIDTLIGDTKVYEDYSLPRMSGPELCKLCTKFGLTRIYTYSGVNCSRWQYMQDLLWFLNQQNRIPELLDYLIEIERFEQLKQLGTIEKIKEIHNSIINAALEYINSQLVLSQKEVKLLNHQFVIGEIGKKIVFDTPKVQTITNQYIRELPERIKGDIEKKDYDSVITKSRTLLEEVLIFIIEHLTKERYKSNGKLVQIYQDVTELLNMRTNGDWDKRINELLGGLHKIVSAISSMRDINSDAHGVGSRRLNIDEREALLVAHSAMLLSEYWLSVYDKRVRR